MKKIVLGMLTFYRKYISPVKSPCCRFYPTCSQYGVAAVEKYGVVKGLYLVFKRLLRCNPFCEGGYDPLE